MIIAQMWLRLDTVYGLSEMCGLTTQHNPTDFASFEGACNCQADWWNVNWIVIFLATKISKGISENLMVHPFITTDQNIFKSKIVRDQSPGQLLQQLVCIIKLFFFFCTNCQKPVSEKLICINIIHIRVSTWLVLYCNQLEWANAHIRWHWALWGGVVFTDKSWLSLHRADVRQCVGVVRVINLYCV